MNSHPDRFDWVPGSLAIVVTILVALATLTPYLWPIPASNATLITQAQTTLYNGWMMVLAYYFGSSAGQRKSADAINTLAQTAQTAQAALAPASVDSMVLAPGETATATATESGTTIDKEPPP